MLTHYRLPNAYRYIHIGTIGTFMFWVLSNVNFLHFLDSLYALQTKGDGNRIKFHILEADIQCVTVSFRDGNTTDSNLLEVISTTSRMGSQYPVPGVEGDGDGDEDGNGNGNGSEVQQSLESLVMMTIESTGGSLSIAASDESSLVHNCTSPSIYFFAFYQIISTPPSGKPFYNTLHSTLLHD